MDFLIWLLGSDKKTPIRDYTKQSTFIRENNIIISER